MRVEQAEETTLMSKKRRDYVDHMVDYPPKKGDLEWYSQSRILTLDIANELGLLDGTWTVWDVGGDEIHYDIFQKEYKCFCYTSEFSEYEYYHNLPSKIEDAYSMIAEGWFELRDMSYYLVQKGEY